MVKTIYTLAAETAKKESARMADIIKETPSYATCPSHDVLYKNQKKILRGMRVWQDEFDSFYKQVREEKSVSEEVVDGLAKLVEGKRG